LKMHGMEPRMLLTVPEAAAFCRVSASTLNKLRCSGLGPAFTRCGLRKVAYRREALVEWLASRERRSTSEKGAR
jgi:predicted DNA-binding transcriptional regulator AlpA